MATPDDGFFAIFPLMPSDDTLQARSFSCRLSCRRAFRHAMFDIETPALLAE
jgi:hypothetical protein